MYSIVLEKERKLTENMKINGLVMSNYWLVHYFFCFLYYMLTAFVWWFSGTYIFHFKVFRESSSLLLFLITVGWGLAQISFAFFLSVFIHKASTASIIGYGVGIYLMIMACLIQCVIYWPPYPMPWYLYIEPTFSFVRGLMYLTYQCKMKDCYKDVASFTEFDGQMTIASLYIEAFLYIILAYYFQ